MSSAGAKRKKDKFTCFKFALQKRKNMSLARNPFVIFFAIGNANFLLKDGNVKLNLQAHVCPQWLK